MDRNFIAIDVETANSDRSSICQIGMAEVREGRIVEEWSSLVNPETNFDERNMRIHFITPDHVKNAPIFPQIIQETKKRLLNAAFIICHSHFDFIALKQALEEYALDSLIKPLIDDATWADSCQIAREVWPKWKNHKLPTLADHLGIVFEHHDALDDARTAAKVVLHAIKKNPHLKLKDYQLGVEEDSLTDMSSHSPYDHLRNGGLVNNVDATIVFTGDLSISRKEATELAEKAGCTTCSRISKKVTALVIGNNLINKRYKTNKMKDAEQFDIKILSEADFIKLISI